MEWASFFVSGDFWVKFVLAGIVVKIGKAVLWRGARASKVGMTRWVGTLSDKRRREWFARVLTFARYREAYELTRHQNRSSQIAGHFIFITGVLFYVAAVAAAQIHVSAFWMLLIGSVVMLAGSSYVDTATNRMTSALNSAGRIYVRREARKRLGLDWKAKDHRVVVR